jgi:hypothetical protein
MSMTYCDLCFEDVNSPTGLMPEDGFLLCEECEDVLESVNAEFSEEDE